MKTYMIGYDLVGKPRSEYTDLIGAIQNLGGWWHCLDSTWLVKSNSSAVIIRDTLLAHLHEKDRLLVALLEGERAWSGFDQKCSDWLKTEL